MKMVHLFVVFLILFVDTMAFESMSFHGLSTRIISNRSSMHETPNTITFQSIASRMIYHCSTSTSPRRKVGPSTTKLHMVRNIDLPEALVFYGVESMMEASIDESTFRVLRPGITRLLSECLEVGTATLLLSEDEADTEKSLGDMFQNAYLQASNDDGQELQLLMKSEDPVVHFRCLSSKFEVPTSPTEDETLEADPADEDTLEFYNLQASGRSPSPAFLLDSLLSIHIDPRGFGGSEGFGRGQWIDPRRSPMPARTVVFVVGDRVSSSKDGNSSMVKDRCDAARAAGCRVIYLEQIPDGTQQSIAIEDDTHTMSLCDAVIDTYGNANPRDLQPINLDAISTPGNYWLNPPNPRDDMGNAVSLDDLVEWYRSERELDEEVEGAEEHDTNEKELDSEMSEEEMNKILADLDGL